jgi:transposase
VIDRILFDDKSRPRKQQHTAKRIFERLRDEYGFTGGLTIVKDYVAGWRQRAQEMFVPLEHPPGHAQVDFGEAIGVKQWPFSISVAIRSVPLAAFQAQCAAPGRPEQALCPEPCLRSRKGQEAAATRS